MLLLPPPDPTIELIDTPYSHGHLWHDLTFSYLLHWDLLCHPFKHGRAGWWTVAMRRTTYLAGRTHQ